MPHDGPGEHYHDLGERVGSISDTVTLTTVGLDIGSSTSQAVFSKITLQREDAYYVVSDRSTIHQSEVILTPYATPVLIDGRRLAAFVDAEFAAAGLSRAQIDAGAVIMTGLALSKHNSRAIADVIADESGTFVAVSAGDLLEARLAASGAGLPDLSVSHGGRLLHVDIGGGTTKLSVWRNGELLRLGAIDVGARLLTFDEGGRIARLEAPLLKLAETLNIEIKTGDVLSPEASVALGAALAQEIFRYGGLLHDPMRCPALRRTAPLYGAEEIPAIDAVIFSGGVSEYVYGREQRSFGDLGMVLGRAVRSAVDACGIDLIESPRGIRATVLGASQHTMQLSGNTIFVSDASRLPLRNLPVALPKISLCAEELDSRAIEDAMIRSLEAYTADGAEPRAFGIAISWHGSPTYRRLDAVASALARSGDRYLHESAACVVIVDGDVAGILGDHLNRIFAGRRPVLCLDGIHVHEFDHIDIGEFASGSAALPVVVKSLLFAQDQEHTHAHH